jgi:hypothetical protein
VDGQRLGERTDLVVRTDAHEVDLIGHLLN